MACSGSSEDTGSDDDTQTEDTFVPNEGAWSGNYSVNENDCGVELSSGEHSLTLVHIENTAYAVTASDVELTCALSDRVLSCEPIVVEELNKGTYSLITTVQTDISFETASTLNGVTGIENSCVGDDCASRDACLYTVAFDADHVSE